jgi:hypothetical protein
MSQIKSLAKPTVRLKASQILDLPHSSFKLGPLTLEAWHTVLSDYFTMAHQRSPQISSRGLSDLDSFFRATMPEALGAAKKQDKDVLSSIKLQFIARFSARMLKKGLSPSDYSVLTVIFFELKDLQLNLEDRKANNEPFNGLLKMSNQRLAEYSKKLPYLLKVV